MNETASNQGEPGRLARLLKRAGLPVLVLCIGALIASVLVKTAPKARRKPPVRNARLVEVLPVQISSERVTIYAMGTVRPAREINLQPRVSGQIVEVSEEFIPGGHFKEGEMLVKLDTTDLELAVRQRESDLARMKSDLALELGRQEIAQHEYELLGDVVTEADRELVLRQPQLDQVRAAMATAEAALEQARLNLDRTTVKAPFNATVRARSVNLGMQVTPAATLATLTGTDYYWVEATVPVDQLQWIEVPVSTGTKGPPVRLYSEAGWGGEQYREGHVVRLMNSLEEEGRMARLLVEVEDPLALTPGRAGRPRLLLGEYVRVEIEARELEGVVAVDRRLVRDDETVWIMNEQGQLAIREVDIVFRGREQFLLRGGVEEGDLLVVTELSAPVEGMPLRTQDESAPGAGSQ